MARWGHVVAVPPCEGNGEIPGVANVHQQEEQQRGSENDRLVGQRRQIGRAGPQFAKGLGHVVSQQFGQRYAALSTLLLQGLAPAAPGAARLGDRELVTCWLERNDAQNYLVLGDPAVRIRKDALA